MRDVAAGKTAKDEKTKRQGRRIVRGGQIVANRMQALLSKMFELAEDWELRPAASNPCRGAKRSAEHKMERFLSKEELSRLGAALLAAEQNNSNVGGNLAETLREGADGPKDQKAVRHRESKSAMTAIRLLLLTGRRVGEILNLQWSNVDLERRLLLLPDSKTGAKTVYLSAHAHQLLMAISREPEHDYVLPGRLPSAPLHSDIRLRAGPAAQHDVPSQLWPTFSSKRVDHRVKHLVGEGFARRQGQQILFARDLLNTLRRRELDAAGAKLSSETGLPHHPSAEGEHVAGVMLTTGGVDWSFGRKRGRGL